MKSARHGAVFTDPDIKTAMTYLTVGFVEEMPSSENNWQGKISRDPKYSVIFEIFEDSQKYPFTISTEGYHRYDFVAPEQIVRVWFYDPTIKLTSQFPFESLTADKLRQLLQ